MRASSALFWDPVPNPGPGFEDLDFCPNYHISADLGPSDRVAANVPEIVIASAAEKDGLGRHANGEEPRMQLPRG